MSSRFYGVPDTGSVREIPQPIQHLANAAMAKQLDGEIVFYTMEDRYTLHTHEVIRGKLEERPAIDGVIFFRLAQFLRDGARGIATLRWILERGYAVAFSREQLAIRNRAELERLFPLLATTAWLDARDRDRSFVRSVLPLLPPNEARS